MASTAIVIGRGLFKEMSTAGARSGAACRSYLFRVVLVAARDDLLAAIEAVRRDAVARVRLARSRVDGQRRAAEAVVRTMHAALGRCLSALLNCHGSFLQQIPQILKRLLHIGPRGLLHYRRR